MDLMLEVQGRGAADHLIAEWLFLRKYEQDI